MPRPALPAQRMTMDVLGRVGGEFTPMKLALLSVLRPAAIPAALLLAVPMACSSGSGSGGGGDGSCGGTPAAEGAGWNLGRAPLDPSAAARAAVFMASCVPDDNPNITLLDYYASRGRDAAAELDEVACLAAKANGCQAVADCLGITATFEGSCSSPYACHGNVLQVCDDNLEFRADCTKLGGSARCDPSVGCVPCDGAQTAPSCDNETFTDHCEDGRAVRCDDGFVVRGLRCADLGLECQPDSFGDFVGCYGKGAECQTNWGGDGLLVGTGCAGSVLEACVGERSHSLDCGEIAAGFSCQSVAAGGETSYFCGLAAECDGAANPPADPTCDGNSVVLCNAGRIEKIDCLSLGFTGCAPQWGRCVPGPYAEI